jgi:hypothetical protein
VGRVRGRESSDWGKGRSSHWREDVRERRVVELRFGLGFCLGRDGERGGGGVDSGGGVSGFTRRRR